MNKEDSEIAVRILNGEPIEDISFKENISINSIKKMCKNFGINSKSIKDIEQESIAREIKNGRTRDYVEKKFSVRLRYIKESCEKHGVAFEPFGLKTDRTFSVIADLINTDKSLVKIANEHGVSVATISDLYRMSIQKELPVIERKAGVFSSKKKYKIAFSFDDFLTSNLDLYREIIGIFENVAEIHFIGFRKAYGEHEIRSRLNSFNIGHDGIFSVESVEGFVNKNKYDIFFGSDDGQICGIDNKTSVVKIRDDSNYDFKENVWVYDERTGVQA